MKKTVFGILIVLLVAFIGYFIIYPYDYIIRFEANTFPGTINQSIKLWDKTVGVPGTLWCRKISIIWNSTFRPEIPSIFTIGK